MNRQKEVPKDLLLYLERQKEKTEEEFNSLDVFCTIPVRAVKMKIVRGKDYKEEFCTVIIPAVDVYTHSKASLKDGYLKRDALSFFVSKTKKAFPYGHVYSGSGTICLGNIFVPSAVPERSITMPLETLFLHNDRNLSHGGSHLVVKKKVVKALEQILADNKISPGFITGRIQKGDDIIADDQIWNLSADVAEQKPLPEALKIMASVFDVVFEEDRKKEAERKAAIEQETAEQEGETENG